MKLQEYKTKAKQEFAKYGFVYCPLTNDQLSILWHDGICLDGAYVIGCDVNAGFSFVESLDAWGRA